MVRHCWEPCGLCLHAFLAHAHQHPLPVTSASSHSSRPEYPNGMQCTGQAAHAAETAVPCLELEDKQQMLQLTAAQPCRLLSGVQDRQYDTESQQRSPTETPDRAPRQPRCCSPMKHESVAAGSRLSTTTRKKNCATSGLPSQPRIPAPAAYLLNNEITRTWQQLRRCSAHGALTARCLAVSAHKFKERNSGGASWPAVAPA